MAQSRIKALERMGKVDAVVRDPTIKFSFPRPETLMGPAIQLIDVSFGYASAKAKAQLEIAEAALSKLQTTDTVSTGTDTDGQSDSTAKPQLTLTEAQAAVEEAKTQVAWKVVAEGGGVIPGLEDLQAAFASPSFGFGK